MRATRARDRPVRRAGVRVATDVYLFAVVSIARVMYSLVRVLSAIDTSVRTPRGNRDVRKSFSCTPPRRRRTSEERNRFDKNKKKPGRSYWLRGASGKTDRGH